MTFSVCITGGQELDYCIETVPSFLDGGIEIEAPLNDEGVQMPVKLWLEKYHSAENIGIYFQHWEKASAPLAVKDLKFIIKISLKLYLRMS